MLLLFLQQQNPFSYECKHTVTSGVAQEVLIFLVNLETASPVPHQCCVLGICLLWMDCLTVSRSSDRYSLALLYQSLHNGALQRVVIGQLSCSQ